MNCVVHCLGHCSLTLFMDTVKKKKSTKINPRVLGHHNVVSELRYTNTYGVCDWHPKFVNWCQGLGTRIPRTRWGMG